MSATQLQLTEVKVVQIEETKSDTQRNKPQAAMAQ